MSSIKLSKFTDHNYDPPLTFDRVYSGEQLIAKLYHPNTARVPEFRALVYDQNGDNKLYARINEYDDMMRLIRVGSKLINTDYTEGGATLGWVIDAITWTADKMKVTPVGKGAVYIYKVELFEREIGTLYHEAYAPDGRPFMALKVDDSGFCITAETQTVALQLLALFCDPLIHLAAREDM